jgi:hypothetical protein
MPEPRPDELPRAIFQVTPLSYDSLTTRCASRQEAARCGSGFDAAIDATPTGLCRNPAALARDQLATDLSASYHASSSWPWRAMSASCGTDDPMAFSGFGWSRDLAKEQAFTIRTRNAATASRRGPRTPYSLFRSAED